MNALTRPPSAPADDEDAWDLVIARAKAKAATLRAPIAPPLPRNVPLELQVTPPPVLTRPAPRPPLGRPGPRAVVPERTNARLDALMLRGLQAPRPVSGGGRSAPEEMLTPPPVARPRWAVGPLPGRAKRS
jgi:hypothetical protein